MAPAWLPPAAALQKELVLLPDKLLHRQIQIWGCNRLSWGLKNGCALRSHSSPPTDHTVTCDADLCSPLAQAELPPVVSCLHSSRRGMKRAMMEVVAGGAVTTPLDVNRYVRATLLAATQDFKVSANALRGPACSLHWAGCSGVWKCATYESGSIWRETGGVSGSASASAAATLPSPELHLRSQIPLSHSMLLADTLLVCLRPACAWLCVCRCSP